MKPVELDFVSYEKSVPEALDAIGAREVLTDREAIMVKPNLITDTPFPVTTPPACCEAIVSYIREYSAAKVVIAEGCGEPSLTTDQAFDRLGYRELSRRLDVPLVDLNNEETVELKDERCRFFATFHIPRIVMEHYLVSVPVLKAHNLAEITGSMKNMIGVAPPRHYGRGGHWLKAAFHEQMQRSIVELNYYRTPDLTLMDASVGLREFHLGGARCEPPAGKLLAGYDAREVDRIAAGLLGLKWESIGHLKD